MSQDAEPTRDELAERLSKAEQRLEKLEEHALKPPSEDGGPRQNASPPPFDSDAERKRIKLRTGIG